MIQFNPAQRKMRNPGSNCSSWASPKFRRRKTANVLIKRAVSRIRGSRYWQQLQQLEDELSQARGFGEMRACEKISAPVCYGLAELS